MAASQNIVRKMNLSRMKLGMHGNRFKICTKYLSET
jgi:hypothetical protein